MPDRGSKGRPARRAPFFAWVHFYDPHSPYTPPAPYGTRYAKAPYDGEVAYTDAILGRAPGPARPSRRCRPHARRPDLRSRRGARRPQGGGARLLRLRGDARGAADRPPARPDPARQSARRPRRGASTSCRRSSTWPARRQPSRPGLPGRSLVAAIDAPQKADAQVVVLLGDAVPAPALRLERPAVGPDGRLEVHPGAAARALRPRARPGRAHQPLRGRRPARGLAALAAPRHAGRQPGDGGRRRGGAEARPGDAWSGWRAWATSAAPAPPRRATRIRRTRSTSSCRTAAACSGPCRRSSGATSRPP